MGGVDRGQKIALYDSAKILEMIARDRIVWKRDEFWGYEVPFHIPEVDLSRFDPRNYYLDDEIQELSQSLKVERLSWLSEFEDLNRDIINALMP